MQILNSLQQEDLGQDAAKKYEVVSVFVYCIWSVNRKFKKELFC